MLDVFITVDVEIWCDGWHDLDARFSRAFERYVHGPTAAGPYGLPHLLAVLGDHGLAGNFFVEPLFSARFGVQPLAEIVGLIRQARQEIQLHLHTEWVDEALTPLLEGVRGKRQHLRHFSLKEQTHLIATGMRLLAQAGADSLSAFRAGSFGFNRDTLTALASNKLFLDASYNAAMSGLQSGVLPGIPVVEPMHCDGVLECPMTVFTDGTRNLRHTQLGACSFAEIEGLLWRALHDRRQAFVLLLHNFELLNQARNSADRVVVHRFRRLCSFLERNRDSFRVRGFEGPAPRAVLEQPRPLSSPAWKTGGRMLEQLKRKAYR
jgi:hypothetical protein